MSMLVVAFHNKNGYGRMGGCGELYPFVLYFLNFLNFVNPLSHSPVDDLKHM